MVQELQRLTDIHKDSKIMFAHGKALVALCEYKRAREALQAAYRLAPANQDIVNELESLEEKYKRSIKVEKDLAVNAMKLISNGKLKMEQEKQSSTAEEENEMELQTERIRAELTKFMEGNSDRLSLPESFSEFELGIVKELTIEMDLQFKRDSYSTGDVYYVSKKSTETN